MMRDDIFPGGVENAPAVGVSDVKPAYTIDPDRAAEDALRWSMATLLFQVLSIILFATAWIPGIEWFYIDWFNGSPQQGQNVGIVSGDLTYTTIDSLGWNGAAFTWTDMDEADVACAGPLVTSDVCRGLQMKITCHGIYDFLMITNMACLIPAMAFTSWIVHQLRFGLILQTNDRATVGYWGCVTQSTSLWQDPCFYVFLQVICFVPGILIGLPAWPIAMLLMRDKFVGLGGLWWGGAQTIFGVQGVVHMAPGYELYVTAAVFFVPIGAFLTLKMRDAHRNLVYGGGVDSSEDMMGNTSGLLANGFSALGGGLTGMLSYVPNFSWGPPAAPAEGGSSEGSSSSSSSSSSTSTSLSPKAADPAASVITYNSSAIMNPARKVQGGAGAGGAGASAAGSSKVQQWAAAVDEDSPFGDSTLDMMDYGPGGKGSGANTYSSSSSGYDDDMPNAFAPSKQI